MNHLLIGAGDKTNRLLELSQKPFLLFDDGEIADTFLTHHRARFFDITKHSFNPLRGIDYKRARDFAAAVYTASPEGQNTLTVRNGKRALTRLLLTAPKSLAHLPRDEKDPGTVEALATIDDVLLSPILKRVLCEPTNFSFKGNVVVKLNRAHIGDFDAFLLASLLIAKHQGQIIVPDFGFYGRDFYASLIRQNRLMASVDYLSQLTPPLQQLVLTMKDRGGVGCTWEDAQTLANFAGLSRDTIGYSDFVRRAMEA